MDWRSTRLGESLNALPPLTVAAMAMYGGAFVLLSGRAITWQAGMNPRWVITGLAIVAGLFFVWIVLRGRRLTPAEVLVMAAAEMTAIVSLTWTTDLMIGALANGTILPILGVFAIWFLHPIAGRAVLYVGTACWLFAITHQHAGPLVPFAFSLVCQTVIATEVFSRIKGRMDRLARTDPLTGALNRRGITEVLERELDRAARRGHPVTVVSVDLDGLREVNNTMGHHAGDQLLMTIAAHWIQGMRGRDEVGRTGGDEFIFVLPATTKSEAELLVARLAAESPGHWSAGIAVVKIGESASTLLERADRRMYEAKASRQNA